MIKDWNDTPSDLLPDGSVDTRPGARVWVSAMTVSGTNGRFTRLIHPTYAELSCTDDPKIEQEARGKNMPAAYMVPVRLNGTLNYARKQSLKKLHICADRDEALKRFLDDMDVIEADKKKKLEKLELELGLIETFRRTYLPEIETKEE